MQTPLQNKTMLWWNFTSKRKCLQDSYLFCFVTKKNWFSFKYDLNSIHGECCGIVQLERENLNPPGPSFLWDFFKKAALERCQSSYSLKSLLGWWLLQLCLSGTPVFWGSNLSHWTFTQSCVYVCTRAEQCTGFPLGGSGSVMWSELL